MAKLLGLCLVVRAFESSNEIDSTAGMMCNTRRMA